MLKYDGGVYPTNARQTVLDVYIVLNCAELVGFSGIASFLRRRGGD